MSPPNLSGPALRDQTFDGDTIGNRITTTKKLEDAVDLGTWIGRKQAFSLIAGRCSAADAECIRQMREKKAYRAVGLNWDRFCRERLGVCRATADSIMRHLAEFGPAFFTLAQVMRITADEYRRISSAVSRGKLLHAGEEIPIEAVSAPRLEAAVEDLRRWREAEAAEDRPQSSICHGVATRATGLRVAPFSTAKRAGGRGVHVREQGSGRQVSSLPRQSTTGRPD